MRELDRQKNQKEVQILIGDDWYNIRKLYPGVNAEELGAKLAEKMYESVRESDIDISEIAKNLGYKLGHVKNIKNHIFINKHYLDRYGPEDTKYKRFAPMLQPSESWNP